MKKSKICIVTAHFLRNYGSVLQAYALQNELQKMGYEVEILNYIPYISSQKTSTNKLASIAKRLMKNNLFFAFKRKKRSRRFKQFRESFMNLTRPITDIDEVADFFQTNFYSAVICGSDQIWNPRLYGGFNPVFFLAKVPESSICISYAPSVKVRSLSEVELKTFRDLLAKFSSISVREHSSVALLSDATDKEIKWVCDPTLLLPRSIWDGIKQDVRMRSRYGVVYGIYSDPELERLINKFSSGIRYYNISNNVDKIKGASNHFADIGPLEFISLISNASIVITNSFHCVVFSIIYEIPFISFEQENDDRITNLLHFLGLADRIVHSCEEALDIISKGTVDYSNCNKRLKEFIDNSKQFLSESLRNI